MGLIELLIILTIIGTFLMWELKDHSIKETIIYVLWCVCWILWAASRI